MIEEGLLDVVMVLCLLFYSEHDGADDGDYDVELVVMSHVRRK